MVEPSNKHRAVVLFDAVGTVIKPVPGIVEIYQELGAKHGSLLSRSEIKRRIGAARRKYFQVGTNASEALLPDKAMPADLPGLVSSDALERKLWRQLVLDVFVELGPVESLFQELWEHFAQPQHWQVYDDVAPCWERLNANGFVLGLASNFDSRLLSISAALLPEAEFVFCSGPIGHRKPSPMFYREIENALSLSGPIEQPRILMVGDDYENDCVAPKLAGWPAVWLNRKQDWQPFSKPQPSQPGLQSLDELGDWAIRICEEDGWR
jgi:putative hydrolase of the HAD superfamily